jgi:hypothetical protein
VIPLRRPVDPLFRALCCSALAALAGSPAAFAQPADSTAVYQHALAPQAVAAHLDGSIRVDGALEEAAWAAATPVTAFTQTDPEEGKPCSERTEVRFLIGDDALYIGARMFDREPAKIKARLSRRDDPVETDAFDVWLDSYHDHLTARRFRVNPAGAILDASIGADGNEDDSWDAVWEAAARVDSLGWTAELRIPLSQLRYNTQQEATWGLQLARTIFRRGEFALFAFTPKKERGGVARYGHLTGLGLLPKQRRLEVVPYLSSRNEHLDVPPGDPFRTRNDFFGATGGDLKYGLTSDLTLDLTVNPDFGQVEVDPAEVNLTAFETLFPERRPFFIEGSDLFAFGRSRAFNNFSVPTVFNSRRIGRSPQLVLGGSNFNSVNAPQQTTIAGAAKLTGRTSKGWSVGVLDAVTTRENADYVDPAQIQRQAEVEPETHYFTGRVRRDLRAGNTSIGALATAVNRKLDDPTLAGRLRGDAYVGGLDFGHAWNSRRWALDADLTGSRLQGTPAAIAAAQRSSARYLQRPDHADYFKYDPTRTRLDGYGFDGSLSKTSGNHWLASLAYVSRSPGYEANDLGFGTRADYRGLSSIVLFQQNKPGKILRNFTMFPYANEMWNFGGDRVFDSYAYDVNGTFMNFYNFDFRTTLNKSVMDDRLTRGGPQARSPENGTWSLNLGSDSRKSYNVNANFQHSWNGFGGYGDFPSLAFSFRPSPTLRLRFEPSYSATHALGQYVTAISDPAATATFGTRYVFSTLDQRVMSLVTRFDWTFRPRLSMQVYLQPLVVTGHFSQFKEFAAPEEFRFDIYGVQRGSIARNDTTGVYTIDPGNGATFQLGDPDFNFRSLLGNAVMRWEYRPGSTLFLVWQQRRTDVEPMGGFDFSRDYSGLLNRAPENVFAVKATYWIGL